MLPTRRICELRSTAAPALFGDAGYVALDAVAVDAADVAIDAVVADYVAGDVLVVVDVGPVDGAAVSAGALAVLELPRPMSAYPARHHTHG